MMKRLSEIAKIIVRKPRPLSSDPQIHTLIYDTRKAHGTASELFLALPGTNRDGHSFIPQAYALGIRSFIVLESFDSSHFPDGNFLAVEDVLSAIQTLSSEIRKVYKGTVIGITGSNGKTIVKEWLSTILTEEKNVLKSPKSYNSQLGVALSIWPLNETHDVAVLEAGISRKGEMDLLQQMISPELGIFTNIGEAHNEGFAHLNEKIAEKARLFKDTKLVICRADHLAIWNHLQKENIPTLTWGIDHPDADIKVSKNGNLYTLDFKGESIVFQTALKSPQDEENILHAIVASLSLGIKNAIIQKALTKLKAIPMRLELKRGRNNTYLLDDTYNNDLLGLEVALDYLLQQPHKQKKTVILSDILQTGKTEIQLYQEVNTLLEAHQISRLIGIGAGMNRARSLFSMSFEGFESTPDFLKNAPAFSDEIILVKGARDFELERVVTYLEERNHGTVLEVNFEAITHNLNVFRQRLKPGVKMMAMVKAFAYGVGVEEIAHLLQYHRIDYLGVAYLDEAINLRRKGIHLPIMIMNVEWSSFGLLETFDLQPEIYSLPMLRKYLEDCTNPPSIHLKLESGMNRLGFTPEDLPELINILQANPELKVAGIFTHFSSTDVPEEDEYTQQQAAIFESGYMLLSNALGYSPLKHALNSSGIVRFPQYQFDMVRLGVGLYGYDSAQEDLPLKPISTLKTIISQVKQVKAGESIGYSRKGRASVTSEIATVAIGYADGYSRAFGNGRAQMLVNGHLAPTIGNICMDMCMLDVSGLGAKEGDEVTVFGDNPSIAHLAAWSDTIPYEILTSVSQRVKRVFVSE